MGPFATDTLCQPPHLGAAGVRGWGVGGRAPLNSGEGHRALT